MERKHLPILIFFTVTFLVINLFGLSTVLYLVPISIFLFSLRSPILGISLWIISIPLGTHLLNEVYHLNIAFLNLALITRLFVVKMKLSIRKDILLFVYIFALLVLISAYNAFSFNFSLYLYTFNSILMFFLVAHYLMNYKDSSLEIRKYIILSTVIAATTMIILVLKDYNSMISYERLAFGGNVRKLANSVGLPILFLFTYLIEKKQRLFTKKSIKILASITLIMFSVILILSASRGVIYALIIAFIAHIIIERKKISVRFFQVSILIVILIIILQLLNLSSNLQIERIIEFSSNNRDLIWNSAISEYLQSEIFVVLFGAGIGNFNLIALEAYGVDTYSHSVFIDILTSMGLIGFISLMVFIIKLLIRSLKVGDKLAFTLIVFTIVSFSTHGQTYNLLFWLQLSIAYALVNEYSTDVVARANKAKSPAGYASTTNQT